MKKIIFATAILCLFLLPSCKNALKSVTGRQLDNKEDLEYALNIIKERVEKKKVPEASIDGSGRELKNSIDYVRIYDLSDKNEVSSEMIGIGSEYSSIHTYEPSDNHNSNADRRGDPTAISGLDPAILNADLLMQVLEKAKAILVKDVPEYTFKVVGGWDFEVENWSWKPAMKKTIGKLTLHVTKASDSQYTSNYYYEVKFNFDKDGNVTLID